MPKQLANYDQVNLVNDNDEIIGSVDKLKAHLGEALLHQAISLFLFKKNSNGGFALLIQKRSGQKIVGANQWANTVCGNVAWGENHQQCLWRRLKDELGIVFAKNIRQQAEKIQVFKYQTSCNEQYSEKEIDHIFALFLNEQQLDNLSIRLNPLEVSEFAWVDWSNLAKNQQIVGKELTPWFKIFLTDRQIKQRIDHFLENIDV